MSKIIVIWGYFLNVLILVSIYIANLVKNKGLFAASKGIFQMFLFLCNDTCFLCKRVLNQFQLDYSSLYLFYYEAMILDDN